MENFLFGFFYDFSNDINIFIFYRRIKIVKYIFSEVL